MRSPGARISSLPPGPASTPSGTPSPRARSRDAQPGRTRIRAAARAWRRSGCRASPARPRHGSRPARGRAARAPPYAHRARAAAPERARHHCQHGVVDGAAQRVLYLLEVGKPALDPPDPPVRADLHVERDIGNRVIPVPDVPLNVEIGPHRRIWWVQSRLADFKEIKEHAGRHGQRRRAGSGGGRARALAARARWGTEGRELRALVPVWIRGGAGDARQPDRRHARAAAHTRPTRLRRLVISAGGDGS